MDSNGITTANPASALPYKFFKNGKFSIFHSVQYIARGGEGRVYIAREVGKNGRLGEHRYALKDIILFDHYDPLSPEERVVFIQQLQQTWENLFRVKHPHLVKYYHADIFFELPGRLELPVAALVMEYCPKGSLKSLMRAGPLNLSQAKSYTYQILSGLAYLHANRQPHRDLKPDNVVLRDVGLGDIYLAKLVDFDQSIVLSDTVTATQDRDNWLVYTRKYMPPEFETRKKLSRKSDIWSFACVVKELLLGSKHIAQDSFESTDSTRDLSTHQADRIRMDLMTKFSDEILDHGAVTFLSRCFREDPQDRAEAGQLLRDLWLAGVHFPPRKTVGQQAPSVDSLEMELQGGSGAPDAPYPARDSPSVDLSGISSDRNFSPRPAHFGGVLLASPSLISRGSECARASTADSNQNTAGPQKPVLFKVPTNPYTKLGAVHGCTTDSDPLVNPSLPELSDALPETEISCFPSQFSSWCHGLAIPVPAHLKISPRKAALEPAWFDNLEAVTWKELAEQLCHEFEEQTGTCLRKEHLQFLAAKLLGREEDAMDDFSNSVISRSRFLNHNLLGRNFTFWDWFYHAMHLVKDHLHELWIRGYVHGFLARQTAQEWLLKKPPGTFLLRFSDSVIGGVSIAYVRTGNAGRLEVLHIQPYNSKNLETRSCANRVQDMADQLFFLYPGIPRNEAFVKFYPLHEVKSYPTYED